jgi:hypothetical protein
MVCATIVSTFAEGDGLAGCVEQARMARVNTRRLANNFFRSASKFYLDLLESLHGDNKKRSAASV